MRAVRAAVAAGSDEPADGPLVAARARASCVPRPRLSARRGATFANSSRAPPPRPKRPPDCCGRSKRRRAATGQKGLTQALAEAGELVSQLRKRVQLDERLDQMAAARPSWKSRATIIWKTRSCRPGRWPGWAHCSCWAARWCCSSWPDWSCRPRSAERWAGPWDWSACWRPVRPAAIKFGMEHSASSQLDTCHQQIDLLKEQIKQARAERD